MSKKVSLENLKVFLEESDQRFVHQRPGFGLSSNDFEDEYKDRIKSIEAGAERNTIMRITVNNEPAELKSNRTANIELPELTQKELDEVLGLEATLTENDEIATEKDINDLFLEGESN